MKSSISFMFAVVCSCVDIAGMCYCVDNKVTIEMLSMFIII